MKAWRQLGELSSGEKRDEMPKSHPDTRESFRDLLVTVGKSFPRHILEVSFI